ncbi:radical SAM protein, partial [Streptosporangium algeriense]
MPSTLPDGDPVPPSGDLPESALHGLGRRPFGFYVHVPFCVTRCGYCDFNTYTASELGPGASREDYARTAIREVRRARANLGEADLPVETVFFGGGTPTLLPAADLVRVLRAIGEEFGLAPGAEVTTEANPESVGPAYLEELRGGGFTRMSFGMQSAREHVLRQLLNVESGVNDGLALP